MITVECSAEALPAEIFDQSGKVVLKQSLQINAGKTGEQYQLTAKGIYSLRIGEKVISFIKQ